MTAEPDRKDATQPRLKIIRTLWHNSPIRVSYVVVDLNRGQEYPQNFVCVFPKNLFRSNQKGNLRRSKFYHVFGKKTRQVAETLLKDALQREKDPKIKAEIQARLEQMRNSTENQVGQRVPTSL